MDKWGITSGTPNNNDTVYVAAVRGCMYQLCQLRRVKRSLTLDSRRALATACLASRIDYCNGVLYGVAKGEVQRLQMVLNAAARLVVGTGKFSHVTSILCDVLHWLSVYSIESDI